MLVWALRIVLACIGALALAACLNAKVSVTSGARRHVAFSVIAHTALTVTACWMIFCAVTLTSVGFD